LFEPSISSKVTDANILIEDGSTAALYESDYEGQPTLMSRLMLENPHNIDLFFIISLIAEEPPDQSSSGPVCYNYVIGVQSVTIHKYDSSGSLTVNGDKLARQAKEEIRRIIRENPYGSLRNVRGARSQRDRVGKDFIYGDVMEVLYKQYVSNY
jgi:hypothetical protein